MYVAFSRRELLRLAKERNIIVPRKTADLAYRLEAFDQGKLPEMFMTTYQGLSPVPAHIFAEPKAPTMQLLPDLLGLGSNILCDVLLPYLFVTDLFALRLVCKELNDKSTQVLKRLATKYFGCTEFLLFTRAIPRWKWDCEHHLQYSAGPMALWLEEIRRVNVEFDRHDNSIAKMLEYDIKRRQRLEQDQFRKDTRGDRAKALHPTLLGWDGTYVTFDGVPITTTNMEPEMAMVCRYIHQGFNLKDGVTVEDVPDILQRYSQSEHLACARQKQDIKNGRKKRPRKPK